MEHTTSAHLPIAPRAFRGPAEILPSWNYQWKSGASNSGRDNILWHFDEENMLVLIILFHLSLYNLSMFIHGLICTPSHFVVSSRQIKSFHVMTTLMNQVFHHVEWISKQTMYSSRVYEHLTFTLKPSTWPLKMLTCDNNGGNYSEFSLSLSQRNSRYKS